MNAPDIRLARDIAAVGEDVRRLRREVARGGLVRPHRGAFVDAGAWQALGRHDRYRLRVVAAASVARTRPVVSHLSAAALWGAPIVGHLPDAVDVLASVAAGSRTEHGFRKHASAFHDDVVTLDGVAATGLVRTLADVAATADFVTAVAALDWAIACQAVRVDDVLADLDRRGVVRGRARATRAVEFADGRSGSPGESLSRARMHEFGFPAPDLQCRFDDESGLIGYVDFWWPEFRLVGEFDGLGKYVREEFAAGRSVAEVVIDEKRRENRIRAVGPGVVRWEWNDAWLGAPMAARLRSAGLPSARRR